jgi:peptidoglycan/LPS O-acetylase OafA/YrhL
MTFDAHRVYYAPDTNAFILLLGCSLAVTPPKVVEKVPSWLALASVAALIAVSVVLRNPSDDGRNWVVVAAAFAAVVAVAGSISGSRLLSVRFITFFGTISYGLYLWHNVLLRIMWGGEEPSGLLRVLLAAIAIAIAYSSFRFIERPIQKKLRPRFVRRVRLVAERAT